MAPTLFRAILTPSLMGIPWLGVLGWRKWDGRTGADGARDWKGAVDGDWGWTNTQADPAGTGVRFFGADAIEDLVILQRDIADGGGKEEKKRTNCCKISTCNELLFQAILCGNGSRVSWSSKMNYRKTVDSESIRRGFVWRQWLHTNNHQASACLTAGFPVGECSALKFVMFAVTCDFLSNWLPWPVTVTRDRVTDELI